MNYSDKKVAVVILAAGRGTRMNSPKAKVLHPIIGKPMINYVVETAEKIAGDEVIVVIGHQREKVREIVLNSVHTKFATQDQQKGTGHAVGCALPKISKHTKHVIILCGDVPLLRPETIRMLIDDHIKAGRDLTFLAVEKKRPHGYGRVIMDKGRKVSAIIEESDATGEQKKITVINAGIYCITKELLKELLPKIRSKNIQGEIYFTDIVGIAYTKRKFIGVFIGSDEEEVIGINTIGDLKVAENTIKNGHFNIS